MRRLVIVLALGTSCKKNNEPPTDPVAATPSRGTSVTNLNDLEKKPKGGNGSGGPTDGGITGDAQRFGGNGSPPYIDDEAHLHGPGGPIFMGRGDECNAQRNHCQRDPAWFAVGNLVAGKLYRAVPVFEYNGKWHTWRGKEEDYARLLLTKVGTKDTLLPGEPVIWFVDDSSKKFVDTEYEALTSSRWEAGVIDSVEPEKVRVKGWTSGPIPIDTTRIVIEQKLPPKPETGDEQKPD
jgi:hypothetical protein